MRACVTRVLGLATVGLLGCRPEPGSTKHIPDGVYVGLEPMGDLTPDEPGDSWYHENTLTVRQDSLYLKKVPVSIRKQEKSYSSSDGGFYNYKGTVAWKGDSATAQLLLTSHDYVLIRYRLIKPADTALAISFEEQVKRGIYVVDSSVFKKAYPLMASPGRLVMAGVAYQLK